MTEEINACQGEIWDKEVGEYKPCNRSLFDDKYCICHSEDTNKDIDEFLAEVQRQLDRKDYHDFTGFEFPLEYSFMEIEFAGDAFFNSARFGFEVGFKATHFCGKAEFSYTNFGSDVDFDNARFGSKAVFFNAKFEGVASFDFANFGSDANFGFAEFGNEIYFLSATFGGAVNFTFTDFNNETNFWSAKFRDHADFSSSEFGGDVDFESAIFMKAADFSEIKLRKEVIVKFDGGYNQKDKPVFQNKIDFKNIDICKDAKIIFRKIDLGECEFLETDLTKVEFIDVNWAKTGGFGKWFRNNAVYDAIKNGKNGEYDHRLIAQLYRRLQINYIDNCHYSQAGGFHIGEQDAVRKGKGNIRRFICPNMFYKIVSNYGESIIRPFLWLMFILFLFPAIFLYSGIDIASPEQQEAKPAFENKVNYELSSDCMLITTDYWDAFTANLSFISFSRGQILKRLHSQYQVLIVYAESVLVIVLISFFVLALRRPFKRKI